MDARSSPKDCSSDGQQARRERELDRQFTATVVIVDTCVAAGATERATFEVFVELGVVKLLGQPKIDSEEYVPVRPGSYEEILRLDIAMEKSL